MNTILTKISTTLDTQYLASDKSERSFKPFSKQSLSILHLNIRSRNKKFEAFKQFYLSLTFNFNIACFSEIWANYINVNKNPSFQCPNYNTEHQIKKQANEEVYASLFMNELIV